MLLRVNPLSHPSLLLSSQKPSFHFRKISASVDFSHYKNAFARRMALAGLKPHHRIALGVSGGPDSIALCVLVSSWKMEAQIGRDDKGFIDGLLGIVVDHGLRPESNQEAHLVSRRLSHMGIRCEVRCCAWSDGKPQLGHLQEAARDMRYQKFQDICIQKQIGILLLAHHADDQAELFILRLSRKSGVLGLAGMAFTSQIFPSKLPYFGDSLISYGILLARPLLDFSKEDMYKICLEGNQNWVEDPTNRSTLFARSRIRMALSNLSCTFRLELVALISACQRTRSFVDHSCRKLIGQAVSFMAHGYAVVDLKRLDSTNLEDLILSKFATMLLQFISQRLRPVRGRTLQLVMNYIRNYPCKTSLTAAGCYLCAAPGSKGTKILVCCSPDSPQPSRVELSPKYSCEEPKHFHPHEIEQIFMATEICFDHLLPDILDVPFLRATSSDSILNDGLRLKIISSSTYERILSLQREESEHFSAHREQQSEHKICDEKLGSSLNYGLHEIMSVSGPKEILHAGLLCHFMSRFVIRWHIICEKRAEERFLDHETAFHWELKDRGKCHSCQSCVVGCDTVAGVRYMVDSDWLYLAKLSTGQTPHQSKKQAALLHEAMEQNELRESACSDYIQLSAQRALQSLKSIPVSARRALPVLVDCQGLLLSVPSICFEHCPYLSVYAVFNPRVPLGGGCSSYV